MESQSLVDISSIPSFNFPSGEMHVNVNVDGNKGWPVNLLFNFTKNEDLVKLMLVVNAYNRAGVQINQLHIPYVPFGRQDRINKVGEPLSIEVFSKIINDVDARKVFIIDPHSDVTSALIKNCVIVQQHELFVDYFRDKKDFVLVSPDAGAIKKIYKLANVIGCSDIIECSKNRNTSDGSITNVHINGFKEEYIGKDFYVVDDICQGGRTFFEIGVAIRKLIKNNGRLILMISHGFFSHPDGVSYLTPHIYDEIYTKNGLVKRN